MVGEHDLAEDLTQETLMRAYRSLNTLRGESKLSTCLCGIAKNVALNKLRERHRELPTIEINDSSVTNVSEGEGTAPDDLISSPVKQLFRTSWLRWPADRGFVCDRLYRPPSYLEVVHKEKVK